MPLHERRGAMPYAHKAGDMRHLRARILDIAWHWGFPPPPTTGPLCAAYAREGPIHRAKIKAPSRRPAMWASAANSIKAGQLGSQTKSSRTYPHVHGTPCFAAGIYKNKLNPRSINGRRAVFLHGLRRAFLSDAIKNPTPPPQQGNGNLTPQGSWGHCAGIAPGQASGNQINLNHSIAHLPTR